MRQEKLDRYDLGASGHTGVDADDWELGKNIIYLPL